MKSDEFKASDNSEETSTVRESNRGRADTSLDNNLLSVIFEDSHDGGSEQTVRSRTSKDSKRKVSFDFIEDDKYE